MELYHLSENDVLTNYQFKFICYHLKKLLDFQYWLDNLKTTQLTSQ